MSPEEYVLGEYIDEITNVFTLGRTGFSLFSDSNYDINSWELTLDLYHVLMKASSLNRENRFSTIKEFRNKWNFLDK